jgi:hypothetical protein
LESTGARDFRSDLALDELPAYDLPPTPPLPPEPPEPPPEAQTLGDHLWSGEFGLPSVSGEITCAIRYQGDLIVAGRIESIGNVAVRTMARWDGTAWQPMGSGINGSVRCMVEYNGELIVAGNFQYVDGELALHFARWDGTTWRPLGAQLNPYLCCYEVNALTIYDGALLAAGRFSPNGTDQLGIVKWDGTTWSTFQGGFPGIVRSMVATDGALLVAGTIGDEYGSGASRVAAWNGSSWSSLGEDMPSPTYLHALAQFEGRVYASGYFNTAGGEFRPSLSVWDGASWVAVPGFSPAYVSALNAQGGQLLLGADNGVLRWNGASAPEKLLGLSGHVRALVPDGDGVIAVGYVEVSGPDPTSPVGFHVSRWDGLRWEGFESWAPGMKGLAGWGGTPAYVNALASFGDDLIAAGSISYAGVAGRWRVTGPISRLRATGWEEFVPQLTRDPQAFLVDGDELFALGAFWSPPSMKYPVYTRTIACRYESGAWQPLDTLALSGECMTRYLGGLVAGTTRRYLGDREDPGVYGWDGADWVPIGKTTPAGASPYETHGVRTLTVHRGELIAGGDFSSIGSVPASGIAAWNGTTWRDLSAFHGLITYRRPQVVKLEHFAGRLIVVGSFPTWSGSVPVASWNGSSWAPLSGIRGSAASAAVVHNRLVVSGHFQLQGTPAYVSMAMFDGMTWTALGSGVNGTVRAMVEHEGSLYVAGSFSRAGGKGAFSIARWDGFGPAPKPASLSLSRPHPNPFRIASDFSFTLHHGSHVRVSVVDARGREVAMLDDGWRVAGAHQTRWNGRDRTGKPAPAGVYFMTVRTSGGTVDSRKVVKLR